MTSEKRAKNMLDGMPTKQKITIGVTVIVVLIVIWQIIGLFGGGSSSAPSTTISPTAAPSQMSAQSPAGAISQPPAGSNQPMPNTMPSPNSPMQSGSPQSNMPRESTLPKDQIIEDQQKLEAKYLKQVNDLEQLKLEREIQETNQAIATAKLATVTAEKSTADLLTKPTPSVSDSAYANQLANPTRSGTMVGEALGAEPVTPKEQPSVPDVSYSVISVSQQLNKWTAVLGAQGKLYTISIGDILPLDGSEVVSINKNGVVLKKNGKTTKISIVTAI